MHRVAGAATFPAELPTRQLDHILTDDAGLRARRCETPAAALSDHRPLVIDIERG
jgi:endonuclease/exonuclease/phosphatase family metal-dependent hydrolase